MNTNISKPKSKNKTVYSLRIRCELRKRGFEPLVEIDNVYKPGFKCQIFEESEEFEEAFSEIMKGGT